MTFSASRSYLGVYYAQLQVKKTNDSSKFVPFYLSFYGKTIFIFIFPTHPRLAPKDDPRILY